MQLTLNDIAAVVQIIDVVTARGAIRGDELSQVGALRDRYAAFVAAAQAQEQEATAKEEQTVNTVTEAE